MAPAKTDTWDYANFFDKAYWQGSGNDIDFELSELNSCFSKYLKVSGNLASDALRTTIGDLLEEKSTDNSSEVTSPNKTHVRIKTDKQLNCDYVVAIDFGDGEEADKKRMFMVHEYDVATLLSTHKDYLKKKAEAPEKSSDNFSPRFGVFNVKTGKACDLNEDGGLSSNTWLQDDADMQKMLVQVKFFNGEMVYTEAEKEPLNQWIASENKAELLKLFQDDILEGVEGNEAFTKEHPMYALFVSI